MRRHLVAAGTFTLLLATATGVALADDDEHDDRSSGFRPVVVADGLDNPRQLDLAGDKLLIAEAGRGGNDCVAPPSTGTPTPTDTTSTTPTDTTSATPTDTTSATPTTTGSTAAPVAATPTTSPTPSPTDTTSLPPTDTTSLTPTDTTSLTPTDTTSLTPTDTTSLTPPAPPPPTPTATPSPPPTDTPSATPTDTTSPPASGDESCAGFTGAIAATKDPANDDGRKAERLVDGLFSVATAD